MAQVMLQVGEQGVDIGLFGQLRASGVGVEVAIRALAHAPRDVHVQGQGRELERGGLGHGGAGGGRVLGAFVA